jgi:hypothetical protein
MISFITTLVNRALVDLRHQVFGAVAGELSNLINFLIVVRLYYYYFLYYSTFKLL